MGYDLIGAGFTRRNDKGCDLDAIDALIDAIPDEKLRDEEYLNTIDPADSVLNIVADHPDTPALVRDALKEGAREYDAADSGHMSVDFLFPGTSLGFVFAGGGSYGDDPYEGWSELMLFLNFAEHESAVAEAAGFVCGGLPSAFLLDQYTEEN